MIDLHCHILPEADDGAYSMDEACEMARIAWESGVDTICATSHSIPGYFDNYNDNVYRRRLEELRRRLEKEHIPVKVLPGLEVFGCGEMAGLLKEGRYISLNHSRYLLMEFDFSVSVGEADGYLETAAEAGYVPVVAHPERYACVCRDPSLAARWSDMGYVLQLNRGSLLGRFGRKEKRAADFMIRYQLADVIASDAHSSRERTPYMRDIWEYLCRYYDESCAAALLDVHPRCILENRRLPYLSSENF